MVHRRDFADGGGTFNVDSVTDEGFNLVGGPEGFIYVPVGSPGFAGFNMLVSEWSAGNVATYLVDGEGNPIPATRQDFITDLTGAEGAFIDPLTGDFPVLDVRGRRDRPGDRGRGVCPAPASGRGDPRAGDVGVGDDRPGCRRGGGDRTPQGDTLAVPPYIGASSV